MNQKNEKDSIRSKAAKIQLPGGDAPITGMQSCGDFLEIFRTNRTYRLQTPEAIDPDELNPSLPGTVTEVAKVGSSNHIVARVFIQGCDLLDTATFDSEMDIMSVKQELHSIKEYLLTCESVYETLVRELCGIREKLEAEGFQSQDGRYLSEFPHIEGLEGRVASFLINAKRAIFHLGCLPGKVIGTDFEGSNIHELGKHLETNCGPESRLVKFVHGIASDMKRIVDLRNFQEHPKENKATIVNNYTMNPKPEVLEPTWHLTGEQPVFITEEMFDILGKILVATENILCFLILENASVNVPWILAKIPDDAVDPSCPVQYRLTIDLSRIHST